MHWFHRRSLGVVSLSVRLYIWRSRSFSVVRKNSTASLLGSPSPPFQRLVSRAVSFSGMLWWSSRNSSISMSLTFIVRPINLRACGCWWASSELMMIPSAGLSKPRSLRISKGNSFIVLVQLKSLCYKQS